MTPDELAHELEPVPHDARIRRLVEIGRQAASDPTVRDTLDALERGGFYHRDLALRSCYGSRDGARALRALSDPSRSIRGLALALIPLVCDNAQVASALEVALPDQRRKLLSRLYRRGRQAPIDAFLDGAVDEAIVAALPYASAPVVARHLDRLLARDGRHEWRNLARFHPDIALGALRTRLAAASDADRRLLWLLSAVLDLLARPS